MSPFGFHTPVEEVVEAFKSRVAGRTFVITGTSAKGLGATTAVALARAAPAHLILVARNKAKVEPVLAEIAAVGGGGVRATFVQCDLSDLDSVRRAAAEINEDPAVGDIDVLVNNAGVMAIKDYTLDGRGVEMTLSANHVGHFLLTNLLMPKILGAAASSSSSSSSAGAGDARIVNLTSHGHRISPFRFDDPNFSSAAAAAAEGQAEGAAAYDGWTAYGQSKTANVLFSVELARRLAGRGVRAYAVHPGGIFDTGLSAHLGTDDFDAIDAIARRNTGNGFVVDAAKSSSQGSSSTVAAALDPDLVAASGAYVEDCQVGSPEAYAVDGENARRLWALSEDMVGQKFDL